MDTYAPWLGAPAEASPCTDNGEQGLYGHNGVCMTVPGCHEKEGLIPVWHGPAMGWACEMPGQTPNQNALPAAAAIVGALSHAGASDKTSQDKTDKETATAPETYFSKYGLGLVGGIAAVGVAGYLVGRTGVIVGGLLVGGTAAYLYNEHSKTTAK